MEKNQLRYSIDGSGIASNLTALLDRKRLEHQGEFDKADEFIRKEKVSESAIINNFVRRCSSDEVIKAECQVDKDSEGRVSEGITTYSVQTKTSQLITIGIHENNYAACKDQMAVLGNAVQKAKEKIANNKKETIRKVVGGVTITMAVGLSIWAGSIKLSDWFKDHSKTEEPAPVTTEAATEDTTEDIIDVATPIDAPTDDSYGLEEKFSADEIRAGMEETNQKVWDEQMENLKQIREELGLSTEPVTEVTTQIPTEDTQEESLEDKYSADYLRKSMEETNQKVIEEQKEELEELRKSYEEEYKVKTY